MIVQDCYCGNVPVMLVEAFFVHVLTTDSLQYLVVYLRYGITRDDVVCPL